MRVVLPLPQRKSKSSSSSNRDSPSHSSASDAVVESERKEDGPAATEDDPTSRVVVATVAGAEANADVESREVERDSASVVCEDSNVCDSVASKTDDARKRPGDGHDGKSKRTVSSDDESKNKGKSKSKRTAGNDDEIGNEKIRKRTVDDVSSASTRSSSTTVSSSSSCSRRRKLNSKPPAARKPSPSYITTATSSSSKMTLGTVNHGNSQDGDDARRRPEVEENNPQFRVVSNSSNDNGDVVRDSPIVRNDVRDRDRDRNHDNEEYNDPSSSRSSSSTPSNHNNNNHNQINSRNDTVLSTFVDRLRERRLELVKQEGDGNCLFRAVSLQVYGDASMHGEVRRRCLDFMCGDQKHFAQFITGEPVDDYLRRKRRDGVHGNNPEIQALSELFNRPVEVFVPECGATPINIFHAEYKTSDAPIRLSYHDGNHYNAVIDPLIPTAGLGLGLPGLEPGLADRMQLKKAKKDNIKMQEELELEKVREESMQFQIRRAMKESRHDVDKLFERKTMALSDLEATDFDIEQMVLADSLKSYQSAANKKQPGKTSKGAKRKGKNDPSSSMLSRDPVAPASSSSFASSTTHAPSPAVAASAAASVAMTTTTTSSSPVTEEEYPPIVQELVMNGFELSRVLHARGLIGDNFDDLLAFLMSSGR